MAVTLIYPLRIEGGRLATTDRGTITDLEGSVQAVLETPLGWLDSRPSMGLPELFGVPGGVDPALLREAAERWEPRAKALTASAFDGVLSRSTVTAVPRG